MFYPLVLIAVFMFGFASSRLPIADIVKPLAKKPAMAEENLNSADSSVNENVENTGTKKEGVSRQSRKTGP